MADNKSGASHELGNLFVDIGSSGLGSLLKGLNSLSATFMLTKNAAQQFTKPIMDMSKNAAQGVIGLDKISAVTGLTVDQLQRLQVWTKLNNISFGDFIGQIKNAQQMIFDVKTGMAEMPAALSRMGLNVFDFDAKNPIDFINQVMGKVQQVDEVTGAALLRWLGLNEELLYSFQQSNNVFDERLLLNEQELQNLREQQNSWNTLTVTVEQAFKKWISQQDFANKGLKDLANNTDKVNDVVNYLGTAFKNLGISFKWVFNTILKPIWNMAIKLFEMFGVLIEMSHSVSNPAKSEDWKELMNDPEKMQKFQEAMNKNKKAQNAYKNTLKQQAEVNGSNMPVQQVQKPKKQPPKMNNPIFTENSSQSGSNNRFGVMGSQLISSTPLDYNPAGVQDYTLPSTLPSTTNNNNITFEITQNITGDNPQEIAERSGDVINSQALNIMQSTNQWNN